MNKFYLNEFLRTARENKNERNGFKDELIKTKYKKDDKSKDFGNANFYFSYYINNQTRIIIN